MARLHQRVLLQRRLHDAPLHPLAPPVNDPHLAKTLLVALQNVFLHHARDVPRRERVQVDVVLKGEDDGVFVGWGVVEVYICRSANLAAFGGEHGGNTPEGFYQKGRHLVLTFNCKVDAGMSLQIKTIHFNLQG